MSTAGKDLEQDTGATFSAIFDLGSWDRSIATNAPGQSGVAGSPHFKDLARGWSSGEYFQLPFSDEAVNAVAESTLTLLPRSVLRN
jgi:penicillin amidase